MKAYLIVLAVFTVLLIIGAILLWNFLEAYENTRPKQVAEEVYNKYIVTGDYSGLLRDSKSGIDLFEDPETVCAAITETANGAELKYFTATSDDESKVKYAVTANDRQIASFTLKKGNKKAAFGFRYYVLDSAELVVSSGKKVTVNVPSGYDLFINGKQVGEKYIVADGVVADTEANVPDGIEKIKYTQYSVKNLFSDPVLTAKAPTGEETAVSFSEKSGIYTAALVFDEALKNKHSENVIMAARAYAAYMSHDARFAEVSKYLDKNSAIYDIVRTCEVNWVRDHNGYKIFGEKADEFVRYSDDFFSCRVTLKETITRSGYSENNGEYTENIDLIFYYKNTGGNWLIYEIVTNG